MTENAAWADFAARLDDAQARRDAELLGLDRSYSSALATGASIDTLASRHSRYLDHRRSAQARHTEVIAGIKRDYIAAVGPDARPLPEPAPSRPPYPAPQPGTPKTTTTPNAGALRRGQQPVRLPTGWGLERKQRSLWGIAAKVIGGTAVATLVVVAALSWMSSSASKATSAASSPASSGQRLSSSRTVVYEVEGTAKVVDITMSTASGISQQSNLKVPITAKDSGERGLTVTVNPGAYVSILAQNQGSSGTVTCRITVDGTVVSTVTSSGAYTIASCSGTAY
ncbi:MmpS family transport accessory protein [Arthrobacter methylotrophus]|uniref:MmpS family transport accessory protein n=2 Tax=Arthrobacter methylotrophus TaxID=121291 RepID=A0ABV5UN94_9MICC